MQKDVKRMERIRTMQLSLLDDMEKKKKVDKHLNSSGVIVLYD